MHASFLIHIENYLLYAVFCGVLYDLKKYCCLKLALHHTLCMLILLLALTTIYILHGNVVFYTI